ncbi:hypothetical protein GQ457_07G030890 [Hibiscus cannabinus]
MSWAGPEDIYLSTSLASYLDRKLLVLLRDGRKLMGTLRSFDQFANAVLEGACERVIVGDLYCDIPLGLYVIRGENVVLIGELDLEREELPPHMTRVSVAEIRRAQKAEREETDLKVLEYNGEKFVVHGSSEKAFILRGDSYLGYFFPHFSFFSSVHIC